AVRGIPMVGSAASIDASRTTDGSVGGDSERIGNEERPGIVLLEVEPPDAVIPPECHGSPVERHLGIGVEGSDIRPSLPGIGRRVADRGEIGIRSIAGPGIVRITRHRASPASGPACRSLRKRTDVVHETTSTWTAHRAYSPADSTRRDTVRERGSRRVTAVAVTECHLRLVLGGTNG